MIHIVIHTVVIGACACNVYQALLSKALGMRLGGNLDSKLSYKDFHINRMMYNTAVIVFSRLVQPVKFRFSNTPPVDHEGANHAPHLLG